MEGDGFIGTQMQVDLRNPAGRIVRGTVTDINVGESLTLTNVFVVGTNQWLPRIVIAAIDVGDIHDLSHVAATAASEPEPPQAIPSAAAPIAFPTVAVTSASAIPTAIPHLIPQPVSQPSSVTPPNSTVPFVDPAILSVISRAQGQPPSQPNLAASPTTSVPLPRDKDASGRGSPRLGQRGVLPAPHLARSLQTTPKPSLTTASVQNMNLDGAGASTRTGVTGGAPEPIELEAPVPQGNNEQLQKKRRRGRRGKQIPDENENPSPARMLQPPGRGKGWRQTPMLHSTASFQPFRALRQHNGKMRPDANNGWASEEVTEEMGEFDFEGGLAKFDKRSLFDQMRKDDVVDESSRLVSHNRKTRLGTAGGKNLHYTENVLELPSTGPKSLGNDFWNSEADDGLGGNERTGGRDMRSQQSNRQSDSKSGARRSQSGKASLNAPAPQRVSSSQPSSQAGLYLVPTNRRLEPVSALQMLNLENIAANEVGLTEDMMTENAGRGIAEVALAALLDPAIKVRLGGTVQTASASRAANNGIVAILAGNNKSGSRSIAAARHLRNKGVNVMVCLVGVEREQNLLEDMKQQVRIYRNFGDRVLGKHEFFEHLRKASSSASPPTVSLVIDALLGLTITFEELRTGDQAAVYELIEWANRNEAFVLAVDVPTGVDPTSGKVNLIDGACLYVKPRYVVALGAPKRGLLEALAAAHEAPNDDGLPDGDGLAKVESEEDEWRLYIADIGLGTSVWKKAGTKLRRGVDFGDKWVTQMQYRGLRGDHAGDG